MAYFHETNLRGPYINVNVLLDDITPVASHNVSEDDVFFVSDRDDDTWIKVHKKHLSEETLNAFNLPWEWDEKVSPLYEVV